MAKRLESDLVRTDDMPMPLTKKQLRYVENFYDPKSETFGDSYKSAVAAGFGKTYATRIMYKNPMWLQDARKRLKFFSTDHIYYSLQEVALAGDNRDKLKALELMGKAQGMFVDRQQRDVHVTFTNDIPRPKTEIIDGEVVDDAN